MRDERDGERRRLFPRLPTGLLEFLTRFMKEKSNVQVHVVFQNGFHELQKEV